MPEIIILSLSATPIYRYHVSLSSSVSFLGQPSPKERGKESEDDS